MTDDLGVTVRLDEAVARAFRGLWAELALIGRDPATGGYRRFAWTDTDLTLRAWFADQAARRGLDVTEDRAGNQWAWWGTPGPDALVLGSHLDSVPQGGAFDGPLGVVGALLALDELRARGHAPNRPVAVVNFTDEEGARFGVACLGSRVLTGVLDPERALGLTDDAGLTLADALRAAGRDPGALGPDPEAASRIGTFLELHVEQGRHLAALDTDEPLAVGQSIWPHGRWRLDFPGEANHAGTTALADRDDALLGAAAAVIAARRLADEHGCLATIGRLEVTPNGINAIPSAVTAWLDARGEDPARVQALVADLTEMLDDFGGTVQQASWTPDTPFDPGLARRLSERFGGIPVIGTGAGHDAGILANAGHHTAMLFVRNPTGISHSPAEIAEERDCLVGIAALAEAVVDLTGADIS